MSITLSSFIGSHFVLSSAFLYFLRFDFITFNYVYGGGSVHMGIVAHKGHRCQDPGAGAIGGRELPCVGAGN